MRILQIGKYYPPYRGGMETVLRNLTEGLLEAGCPVTVVVAGTGAGERCEALPGNGDEPGGRLVRVGAAAVVHSQPLTFDLVSVLRREIARSRPQVVHLHLPNPLAAAAWWLLRAEGSLRGVRTAVWYHADITRQRLGAWVLEPLLHACLAGADGICVAAAALAEASPALARWRAKVAVIPFGIAPQPWLQVAPSRDGRFLFVGRLVPYKGLPGLLRALAAVPGAALTIVGEGPQEPELRRCAAELGLGARVRFAGNLDSRSLADELASARALVLPSLDRSEAFGLVQLEAMAAGVAVLTSDLPTGVREVGVPGTTCLLTPPGDEAALGAALARLQEDEGLRRALGEAGRERFRALYTRERMVAALLAWYETLLAQASRREPSA